MSDQDSATYLAWYHRTVLPVRWEARDNHSRVQAREAEERRQHQLSVVVTQRFLDHKAEQYAPIHRQRCATALANLARGLRQLIEPERRAVVALAWGLRRALEYAVAMEERRKQLQRQLAARKRSDARKAKRQRQKEQQRRQKARQQILRSQDQSERDIAMSLVVQGDEIVRVPPTILVHNPFKLVVKLDIPAPIDPDLPLECDYHQLAERCGAQSRGRYESSSVVKCRCKLEAKHAAGETLTHKEWQILANSWRNEGSVPTDDALNRVTVSLDRVTLAYSWNPSKLQAARVQWAGTPGDDEEATLQQELTMDCLLAQHEVTVLEARDPGYDTQFWVRSNLALRSEDPDAEHVVDEEPCARYATALTHKVD